MGYTDVRALQELGMPSPWQGGWVFFFSLTLFPVKQNLVLFEKALCMSFP